MVNEYGAKLDRNGYAPSIIQDEADESCFVCYANGHYDPLNRHEAFGGPFRDKSKRLAYGFPSAITGAIRRETAAYIKIGNPTCT